MFSAFLSIQNSEVSLNPFLPHFCALPYQLPQAMLSMTKLFFGSTQEVIVNDTWEPLQLHALSGVTPQTANIAPSCTTLRFFYDCISDFVLVLHGACTRSNSITYTIQFPGPQYNPMKLSIYLKFDCHCLVSCCNMA